MTLTDLQYQTMVKEFDYGRFGDGLFTQHLGTLQALSFRPRPPGNDTDAANGGKRRIRIAEKDFVDLLKRKDSTGKVRRRRKRRKKRLVEFYDPAYASSPEEAVSQYLDRLKIEQAMAEEEEEKQEVTGEESETRNRQKRIMGIAPKVIRPHTGDATILLLPVNIGAKLPFQGVQMVLQNIMIPFLQAGRALLAGESIYGPKANVTEVKVLGYNYTNLLRYYKMYYECLEIKKKFYVETVGQPMTNIQDVMFQGGERVTLDCHTW